MVIGDVSKADWSQAWSMDWDQGRIGASTETEAEAEPEAERVSTTLCARQAIPWCSREDEWRELPSDSSLSLATVLKN